MSVTSDASRLQRVNFFAGRVLTPGDLHAEQDYFRTRLRRLNLAAFGSGVVRGLTVSLSSDNRSIEVAPGFAIDVQGEELDVPSALSIELPAHLLEAHVYVHLREQPAEPVAGLDSSTAQYSRIQERVDVVVSGQELRESTLLARLRRQGSRWKLVKSPRTRR